MHKISRGLYLESMDELLDLPIEDYRLAELVLVGGADEVPTIVKNRRGPSDRGMKSSYYRNRRAKCKL